MKLFVKRLQGFVGSQFRRWALVLARILASRGGRAWSAWLASQIYRSAMRRDVLGRGIAALDVHAISELLRRDSATMAILTQHRGRISADEILRAADLPELIPLATRILCLFENDPIHRSQRLYETIVLSRVEVGPTRLTVALRSVARIAPTLSAAHAGKILDACLLLSGVPLDPYERPGIASDARVAAAAIIQHHPHLDADVIAKVGSAEHQNVLSIIAAALRRRPADRHIVLGELFKKWNPTQTDALAFGLDCDTRFSSADPVYVPRGRRGRRRGVALAWFRWRAGGVIRMTSPILIGPALVGIGFALVHWKLWTTAPDLAFDWAAALGALGLLVAVNVVSAELSATRLPGPLARQTSFPPSLRAGYSVTLTLAAWAVATPQTGFLLTTRRTILLLLVGTFAVLVVSIMRALLKRTDPADAAARFEKERRAFAVRAGSRIGRVQKQAEALRRAIALIPSIRLESSLSHAEPRVTVTASGRGFHLPSLSRIRRMTRKEPWRSESLTLRIQASLGTIVVPDDELAAIVPSPESRVRPKDFRRVHSVFRPIPIPAIDTADEAAAVLLDLQMQYALRGDTSGASRVARVTGDFLQRHMLGIRMGRRGLPADVTMLPVVPPLRTLVRSICVYLSDERIDKQLESFTDLLHRIVGATDSVDSTVSMLCAEIEDLLKDERTELTAAEALRRAGIHALQQHNDVGFRSVQWTLEKAVNSSSGDTRRWVLDVMSQVVASAVHIDYFKAQLAFDWYWETTEGTKGLLARVIGSSRVGAAALISGALSVAMTVALRLKDAIDVSKLEELFSKPDIASREQSISDISGGYLGPNAEAWLVTFARFAAAVTSNVRSA